MVLATEFPLFEPPRELPEPVNFDEPDDLEEPPDLEEEDFFPIFFQNFTFSYFFKSNEEIKHNASFIY